MFFWQTLKSTYLAPAVGPFQEGVTARATGKMVAANPYCSSTEAHAEWLEGWRATHDLDEDDDIESCRDQSYCASYRG